MTLIATFTFKKVPLFLGDILITSNQEDASDLPLARNVNKLLRSRAKANFFVNESRQKLNLIRKNLIGAWSGDYKKARDIFAELDELCGDGEISKRQLIEFCEGVEPAKIADIGIIFGVITLTKDGPNVGTNVYRCYLGNVARVTHPLFGYVASAGTGREAFLNALQKREKVFEQSEPNEELDKLDNKIVFEAFQFCNVFSATFAGADFVTGGSNILERWGGGYEAAIPINEFYKVGDTLHIAWYIKQSGKNEYVLNLVRKIYRVSYFKDLLIYYVLENFAMVDKKIKFDINFIFVPPVLKTMDDYTISDPNEIFMFEHKFLSTTIWDADIKGSEVIVKVDCLPRDKSNIVVITEGSKFLIAFKQQYIEELMRICQEHFKKEIRMVGLM